MVDHEILLNKLYFYGVRGLAHDWLRSYLFDRSQYVSINGKKSSTRKLEFGVPQGSILGPLLFVIYINDMPNINKSIHFILYADDANIIVTGKTLQIIQKQIQKFIPHLLNWINTNALKLNIDKTKYMIFSNTSKYDINIEINDTKIKRVTQDKFLGVLIDEKLTWAAHRLAVAKKVSSYCGVLFRARHVLELTSLKTLYYSFIQSHLVYCCNVWGAGTKRSINHIFLAQKRAIRTIFFCEAI